MRYELETVSPVHIGSGRNINPIEYILDDKFYRVDMNALFKDPEFDNNKFVNSVLAGAQLYLGEYSPDLGKKHSSYSLKFLDATTKSDLKLVVGSPSAEVREMIKTLKKPFIPGTSVKGALRTALLWWSMKSNEKIFRETEKKLREVRGSPKFADEEVERLVFGSNPNEDILKALQISDTESLGHDELMICETRTLTTGMAPTHRWKGFQTFLEAFKIGSKSSLTVSTNEGFFRGDAARRLGFKDKRDMLDKWPQACNEFAENFVEHEIQFYKQYNEPRELDTLLDFYQQLLSKIKSSKDAVFLHFAWGVGWHGMTVGLLLKEKNPSLLRDLRRIYRLGKVGVMEFPKTRKIVLQNGRPMYPLGWIKLSVTE